MRWCEALLIAMAALALGGCASGVGGGAAVAVGPSGGTGAGAQASVSAVTPNQIRVDWEPEVRGDRTKITGYVYNGWVLAARDIVLLVETLGAGGQVIGRTFGHVDRVVTPGSRSYFEVPMSRPGESYRVTVASIRWLTDDDIFSRWLR